MTELEIITIRITAIDALIDDLLSCPRPSYTVDAQSVKWGEYLQMLSEERRKLIARFDLLTDIEGGGGFEETQIVVE